MLNLKDHMKRIIQLSEQTLVHVQAEKFDAAQDKLLEISHASCKAMKEIADMLLLKNRGSILNKRNQP